MSQRLRSQRLAAGTSSQAGQSSQASRTTRSSQEPVASTSGAPTANARQSKEISFDDFGLLHQAVLGVFMANSMLDSSEVRSMFRNVCEATKVKFPVDVVDYLSAVATTMGVINVALKKYGLLIKKVYSGTSMESCYCLLKDTLGFRVVHVETGHGCKFDLESEITSMWDRRNSADSGVDTSYLIVNLAPVAVHRLQEVFKPSELQYLYALVTAVVESDQGLIPMNSACSLTLEGTRLTQSVAEQHLTKMCALGFVEQNDRGGVMLGARSLAELEPFLRDKNPDAVSNCMLCQGPIGMQGYRCRNNECGQRCHPACLLRLVDPDNEVDVAEKCPNCLTEDIPSDMLKMYRAMGQRKCTDLEQALRGAKENLESLQHARANLDNQADAPARRQSRSVLDESMEE